MRVKKISGQAFFKLWQIAVIILLNILIISIAFSGYSVSALSQMGSRGDEVRQIQTRLKKWGYYGANVDGIFGTSTKIAVTGFQKNNNLTADGIAGKNTLSAMGITQTSSEYGGYSSSDYNMLARLISAEARGESYMGQVAVGAVVLNRVTHASFPNSVSGVIYQSGAFDCMYDGQFWGTVSDASYKAAADAMNGWDPSGGAIYYYNPVTATNKWIRSRPIMITIGKHVFCS